VPAKNVAGGLVLLIDDVEDNRDVYTQFLTFHGIRVVTASDGVEGLEVAAKARPRVIVLDLVLPTLDGWEVARRLKADPATKDIRIIVLTGRALDASRTRAVAAGVDAYLVKPCLPDQLLAEVRRHLKI
jgi:two-component system, cell cycle response regulator DivK